MGIFDKISNPGCARSLFSNTSGDTYAAVMYERNAYEDWSVSVSVTASKSEVAPLNRHSSLQLELLSKILGMHLC